MDWPSRSDLTAEEKQQELIAILDRAASLRMNAIVFQIRPEADALYDSPIEPWSRYLTGEQGRAPFPAWDPLAFAVEEAHKRGLELHAWFNPYRAAYSRREARDPRHVSRQSPRQVVEYGPHLWMDPGIAEVRQRMIRVVLDVVKRYDIDGVHIDDYFYPYPIHRAGRTVDFPDSRSYAAYRRGGGQLSRANWRRRNVDVLIRELYSAVKGQKQWVKVGISPFGIWRPGNPPTIEAGLDTYEELYADSRKWLREGWLDYIAPQLYWPVDPPAQSYPVILAWWVDQNLKGRHVWPGLPLYKIPISGPRKMSPADIGQQVRVTRDTPGATGHVHFNTKVLMQNVEGIADTLAVLYTEPALVPASPWLDQIPPERPVARAVRDSLNGDVTVRFAPIEQQRVSWWVIQSLSNGAWRTAILPGDARSHIFRYDDGDVEVGSVAAVDRNGNMSAPAIVRSR
jgi:uncharacterized lipoprotein YddW (UPF0748 family)